MYLGQARSAAVESPATGSVEVQAAARKTLGRPDLRWPAGVVVGLKFAYEPLAFLTMVGLDEHLSTDKVDQIAMEKLNFPWEANAIRFVLFLCEPLTDNFDLWQRIAGMPPELNEERPREAARRQAGPFEGHVLETVLSPLRIDVVFAPIPQMQPSGTVKTTLGDFRESLSLVREPFLSALHGFPGRFSRVAFNSGALCPTTSVNESYDALRKLCNSASISPKMRDVIFRVNWRKTSGVPGVDYYNRLTTFSALAITAQISAGSAMSASSETQSHYALMDMDFNTPLERTEPLEADSLRAIFDELMAMADENLDFGEIDA